MWPYILTPIKFPKLMLIISIIMYLFNGLYHCLMPMRWSLYISMYKFTIIFYNISLMYITLFVLVIFLICKFLAKEFLGKLAILLICKVIVHWLYNLWKFINIFFLNGRSFYFRILYYYSHNILILKTNYVIFFYYLVKFVL